jgi:hypothetical protein
VWGPTVSGSVATCRVLVGCHGRRCLDTLAGLKASRPPSAAPTAARLASSRPRRLPWPKLTTPLPGLSHRPVRASAPPLSPGKYAATVRLPSPQGCFTNDRRTRPRTRARSTSRARPQHHTPLCPPSTASPAANSSWPPSSSSAMSASHRRATPTVAHPRHHHHEAATVYARAPSRRRPPGRECSQ